MSSTDVGVAGWENKAGGSGQVGCGKIQRFPREEGNPMVPVFCVHKLFFAFMSLSNSYLAWVFVIALIRLANLDKI